MKHSYIIVRRADCTYDGLLRLWIARIVRDINRQSGRGHPHLSAKHCVWSVKASPVYGGSCVEIHAVAP